MKHYLIIPVDGGFVLKIGKGQVKTEYRIQYRSEAIRILDLIGLELRDIDSRARVSTMVTDIDKLTGSYRYDDDVTQDIVLEA